MDAAALAADASTVIGLRMTQAALGGPQTSAEAWRMWSEKVTALNAITWKIWAAGWNASPEQIASISLSHYRPIVAANRRRLMRSRQG
ncbi:hypothetical protein [Sphingomonas humi]